MICPKMNRTSNLLGFAVFGFQLSLSGNHIVDIKGISAAVSLRVLDVSNNSIVAIEGISLAAKYWYDIHLQ